MIINIYGLVYPSTQEVIYVGQTRTSIEDRLDSHYRKLNEAKRGKRTMTKLFKFLDSYLPLRVQVKLLRVVDTNKPFNDADFMEKYYINYYRKINPNLLNETNGGIGGYTAINKSDNEKSIIGRKISNAIKERKKPKGSAEHLSAIKERKKPKGFAEHLSAIRKGKNNPMAQRLEIKIGAYKENNLIKSFEYGFEINEFIGSKSAYSNVRKVLTGKLIYKPYGYNWKYIE